MASYDQSGNPAGGRQPSGQQGSYASGQGAARQGSQGGQQSQYSPSQGQGQRHGMQQSGGRSMAASRGATPDLYSGAGFAGGPFQLISRLSDEMDRLFESFGMGGALSPRSQAGPSGGAQGLRTLWAPHIEVCERNGKLLVQADLPGVRKEDVNVQIEDDAVIIQGERHQESERDEQGFYHSERSYGSFYRMIPLPEGTDAEQANATFKDGVLQIEVPVPQQRQRGRKLEIRDASGPQGQLGTSGAGSATSGGQPSASQSWTAGQSTGGQHTQSQGGSHGTSPSSPGAQQQAEGSSERR